MPSASALANIGELVALRIAPADVETKPKVAGENRSAPEKRFFQALAEIRALKRAASHAGE
jgi:hypothetical protein